MYGVTQHSFINLMPPILKTINRGDIIFISEGEVSGNALFGPFFITEKIHEGLVVDEKKQSWVKPKNTTTIVLKNIVLKSETTTVNIACQYKEISVRQA